MKGKFTLFILALLCLFTNSIQAQVVRSHGLIFSDNLRGGHTMFGNTSMEAYNTNLLGSPTTLNTAAMNQFENFSRGRTSDHANDNYYMKHIDIDGDATYVNGTTNEAFANFGTSWRYYNQNNYSSNPANSNSNSRPWTASNYTEQGTWTSATAPIRFNLESGGTTLGINNNSTIRAKNAYYFRKSVTVSNPNSYSSFSIDVRYDDGVIVYVNGQEVGRADMNSGNSYNTTASSCNTANTYRTATFSVPANLVTATTVIAVEVHQGSGCTSTADMYFDLRFSGVKPNVYQTTNSSSADLVLPAGTNTIKYARLYWGGKYKSDAFSDAELKTVAIRKGNGTYGVVVAANIDKASDGSLRTYQSYADITNFIKTNGAGTYTVADISASQGILTGGGYAGWSIVVVYENKSQPYRSVRVYDGYLEVESNAKRTITLTGLDVPNNTLTLADAYMSTMAWEGDAYLAGTSSNPQGDFIKVNGNTVSNAVNPATNMWNGTISKNGEHVTTKFPNYKNQMGIDIDEMQVGTGFGIEPGAKSVTIEFGTESDQYFPSLFAFSIIMKDPAVTIQKTVQDLNGGRLVLGDEVQYTLQGSNTGQGTAYDVTINDDIPLELNYVANSLEIWNGSSWAAYNKFNLTGRILKVFIGNDATSTQGGTLAKGQTYRIRFRAVVNRVATITNIASITARNTPAGSATFETFSDESSVDIGFDEAPLPVTFAAFSGTLKNGLATLTWTTATEENTSHFELERSSDARNFRFVASVKAHGNSSIQRQYQQTDASTEVSGMVYYRLKVVDIDGKITYSKIIALAANSQLDGKQFTFFPNPVRNGQELKLQLRAASAGEIVVRIVNNSGQTIATARKPVQPGSNIIVLSELTNAVPGIYTVQVINGKEQFAQNILKQ